MVDRFNEEQLTNMSEQADVLAMAKLKEAKDAIVTVTMTRDMRLVEASLLAGIASGLRIAAGKVAGSVSIDIIGEEIILNPNRRVSNAYQAEMWREWHEPEGEKPGLIGSGEFPGVNRFYQYPHERFGDLRLSDHDVRG